jgi:hypothetical protein
METIFKYWGMCESRGEKPKPVFAVIERWFDTANTKDKIKHWSLSRREMAKWVGSLVSPNLYVIVKIERVT